MANDRTEIDAVRHDLLAWIARQRDGLIRSRGMCIASNLELDPPPLPILAIQVEQLATLLGRKAKM